ncbi:MAG TPA: malto-oligosyltrehalose trehalohydrolase [Thermoanaerobaculia bacterium]|nr:malto-oligosyltrehalose trehalohydrolase [Thermoanaerobaculia bacterium]
MAEITASAIPGRETFPPASEHGQFFPYPSPFGVSLGAILLDDDRCEFRVWAPLRERIDLHIVAPVERRIALHKIADGYHEGVVDDCGEGTRYFYVIDRGNERPDPASRHQPEGVHGPSEVIGRTFEWHDAGWRGVALEEYVVYELHVGTFTPEGTFDAIIPRLDSLRDLGITAIELLPIAQFPGERNWGYDGTYVGAAQNSYGGPRALKRLADVCHQRGLALILDVVYNHLGPEGNYLAEFAPYFTDRYRTPWGLALNFDGPYSDDVRWFFIHNALQWIDEFHVDGLRVDAVHAIVDHSAEPFLQDLTSAVRERGAKLQRRVYTIAESDLNDPRVITPKEDLGLGFDAQWSDDYHHSLHSILTGERDGYYQGFRESVSDVARVFESGYLYTGQHSPYRGRKYGVRPKTKDGAKFIVSAQNHDQVGNRMMGERLTDLLSVDKVRIAAAAIILSPFIPMLFMGEEYGEQAPFQYFTSHSDSDLIAAVRKGRAEEFDDFEWHGEPPDPHDEQTFLRSKLNWSLLEREEHASIRRLYRQLLALRRDTPALRTLDLTKVETHADDERRLLFVLRWTADVPSARRAGRPPSSSTDSDQVLLAFNFGEKAQCVDVPFAAAWRALIDTGAKIEGTRVTLPPHTFALWAS